MSVTSKKRSADKRKAEKRKAKEAKRAKYASYAATGRDGAGRRAAIRAKRKQQVRSAAKHMHLMANCGNTGCKECNP